LQPAIAQSIYSGQTDGNSLLKLSTQLERQRQSSMSTINFPAINAVNEFRLFLDSSRSKPYRTIREFAESEVVLPPGGPSAGLRFRGDRQPWAGLFMDEVAKLKPEFVYLVGPSQKGKTLSGHVIPIVYTLFELKESVIVGIPNIDMVADKWKDDLKPVIESSPSLARYMPRTGTGAKDGGGVRYDFTNGTSIRFMTAGGGDKSRAGKTSRVVAITEVDGFGEVGGTSKEGTKFEQIVARTNSHGSRRTVYAESTVSDADGIVWQAYSAGGSGARLMLKCQHCGHYVDIDRQHFTGWEDAKHEDEARDKAFWFCPDCGSHWSEQDRRAANQQAKIAHRGQRIEPDGTVTGEKPPGRVFSMRFHPGHDIIGDASDLAAAMWRAAQKPDQEAAERAISQFLWALPPLKQDITVVALTHEGIAARQGSTERGLAPSWTERITFHSDVGKRELHWVMMAWRKDGRGRVIDYGTHPVRSDSLPEAVAIKSALVELYTAIAVPGVNWEGHAERRRIDVWQADAAYMTDAVVSAIHEILKLMTDDDRRCNRAAYPYFGRGRRQEYGHTYGDKKTTNATVRWIGNRCHLAWLPDRNVLAMEVDVDSYKIDVHSALAIPKEVGADGREGDYPAGAIDLFRVPNPKDHNNFAKHIMAEELMEQFEPGQRGAIQIWHVHSRSNHKLDATTGNFAAAHRAGVAVVPRQTPKQPAIGSPAISSPVTTADGRPFLVTQR